MHPDVDAHCGAVLVPAHGPVVVAGLLERLERWVVERGGVVTGCMAGGHWSLVVSAVRDGAEVVVKVAPFDRVFMAAEAAIVDASSPGTVLWVDDATPVEGEAPVSVVEMVRLGGSALAGRPVDVGREVPWVLDCIETVSRLEVPVGLASADGHFAPMMEKARRWAAVAGDAEVSGGLASLTVPGGGVARLVALDLHPKNVLADDGKWVLLDPWPAVGDPVAIPAKWAVTRRDPGCLAGAAVGEWLAAFVAAGCDRGVLESWVRVFAAWELGAKSNLEHALVVLGGPLRPWLTGEAR